MVISTAAALVGSAVIGVGGSILAGKSQKKAANQASQTAADTAASNNATALNIYNQNKQLLSPYAERGNVAGNAINSLLGLGSGQQQGGQQQGFNQGFPSQQPPRFRGLTGLNYQDYAGNDYYTQNLFNGSDQVQPYQQTAQQANPQQDYNQAFQNYQNSTGYQFRLGEGVRALDSAAAAGGVRNSGAAQKALAQYGQNIGSQEFGNYLGQLANQQGVGLAGASATAGVGNNYVNNVSANNNSAGTAAANAALLRGQTSANTYGQVGNALGNFASSFGGFGGSSGGSSGGGGGYRPSF
jgi:hypothetical protein